MTKQVPAASRALHVLQFLASQAQPATASRIADALGIPRSSTYHLLGAMQHDGFVTHLPEERRYALGMAAFDIGSAYVRQAPLARLGRPVLARLVAALTSNGYTLAGHLAVLHAGEVVYLVEERPPGASPLVTDIDVRLPAHLTASGRALLAKLPDAQIRALFPNAAAFVDRTGAGPKSLPALMRLIGEVRRRGHAQEHGEVSAHFCTVAAASIDRAEMPAAAIALTLRDRAEIPAPLIEAVRRAARELTVRLGGEPS